MNTNIKINKVKEIFKDYGKVALAFSGGADSTLLAYLAKEAGVVFTGAGATYPYKNDPADSNVRIAPTLPPMDELITAMRIFCCCAKVAYLEKLTK